MTRPDSVGGPGENDSDADPDMMKSDTTQPNKPEGDDEDAEHGG
jgi:hypothetical protein